MHLTLKKNKNKNKKQLNEQLEWVMGRNLGERKGPVAMVKKIIVFEIFLVGPEVSNFPANARGPRCDLCSRKTPQVERKRSVSVTTTEARVP